MEKRVLIAFLLSIAVLMGYSLLFPQPKNVGETQKQPGITSETAQETPQKKEKVEDKALPVMEDTAAFAPEREVSVDTDLYSAVISSRGGVIKSWKLKKYTDETGAPVEMAYFDDGVKPLLVVPEGMETELAGKLDYEIKGSDIEIGGDEERSLRIVYRSAGGQTIEKDISFKGGTYAFGLDVKVSGFENYEVLMGESFGSLVTRAEKGYGHTGFLTFVGGKKEQDEAEDLEAPLVYRAPEGWTAVTDKYFIGAIIPEGGLDAVLMKGGSDWGYVGDRARGDASFIMYAGPKEYDRLKQVGHGLDQAVDFGWFTFIAKPLFVALKFFHGIVGNYGWAIIIITVIIKILFAPLTHKQQKSMRRMQKLQPKISELKEKYKGDAQKMNVEMMELYKREKVNPLGGCLPMVVQIPVFIALYNVLNNAIELRQAPFAWWLQDLAAKDPYYILPVLMGVSMFAMQKMTPTTMDPKQAKIMMIMPVVLTFMFINLPSGLVLYFTLSNLLSMAQQLYINRTMEA